MLATTGKSDTVLRVMLLMSTYSQFCKVPELMRDSTEEGCKGQVEVFRIGKVAKEGWHSTRERNVGKVKISQVLHRTQELRELT
jgi:hypothetical protein